MALQSPNESIVGLPWLTLLIAVGVAGSLTIQWLAIKRFGLRTSGVKWGGASPYLTYFWKVEDRRLTRTQFATIYGLPAAFLCAVAVIYAALSPGAFVIIGFILAGEAGSLSFSAKALAKPEGTLVEEIEKGVRFHLPPQISMLNSPPVK